MTQFKAPIPVDHHLHTNVTIDSDSTIDDHVKRAKRIGLSTICITNHISFMDPGYWISQSELRKLKEAADIETAKGDVEVLVGLEADYFEDRAGFIRRQLEEYDREIDGKLSIVLGSIHWIPLNPSSNDPVERGQEILFNGDYHFMRYLADTPPQDIIDRYFRKQIAMIKNKRYDGSPLVDVLSHPDVFTKNFVKYYGKGVVEPEQYKDHIEEVCEMIVERGIGMEVNMGCVRRDLEDGQPSELFLKTYMKYCKAMGVRPTITVGSDIHNKRDFTEEIDKAMYEKVMQRLSACGVEEVAVFRNREPEYIEVSGQGK